MQAIRIQQQKCHVSPAKFGGCGNVGKLSAMQWQWIASDMFRDFHRKMNGKRNLKITQTEKEHHLNQTLIFWGSSC